MGNLLTSCLPHLEAAWNQGSSVEFNDISDPEDDGTENEMLLEESLKNRTIQVIVKIVDYEFAPGKDHDGVWHVEGMSHENIAATVELVLQRDAALEGGVLHFQRA